MQTPASVSYDEAHRRRQRRRVRLVGEAPGATQGEAYSYELDIRGGTGPYTVTVDSGTLPDGLSLNDTTIEGTPTTPGSTRVWLEIAPVEGSTVYEPVDFAVGAA